MGIWIGFEFRNFFIRKRNWILIVLFTGVLLVYIYANIYMEAIREKNKLEDAQTQLDNNIKVQESNRNRPNLSEEDAFYFNETVRLQLEIIKAIEENKWQNELTAKNQINQLLLNHIKNRHTTWTASELRELDNEIEYNNILLKKQIEPIFLNCTMESCNFIRLAFSDIIPVFLLVIIVLFAADTVSREYDSGTINMILTQPVSRIRILIAKIIAQILISLGFFTVLFGASFLALGLLKGFGSVQYPVMDSAGEYIGIGQFIIRMLPLVVLLIIAAVAFSVAVSTLFKNGVTSIFVSILTTSFFYITTYPMMMFKDMAQYNPISYLFAANVVSGKAAQVFGNNSVLYGTGLIVLAILSIVCWLASLLVFSRKEIK